MGSNHNVLNSMKNDNILHQCIGTAVTTRNTESDWFLFSYLHKSKNEKCAAVQFPLDDALIIDRTHQRATHDYRNVIPCIKISWRRFLGQSEHHSAPYNSLFHRVKYAMPIISKGCLKRVRYFGKNGLLSIYRQNIFTRIMSFISAMNLIQKYLFSNPARNKSLISVPLSIPLTVRRCTRLCVWVSVMVIESWSWLFSIPDVFLCIPDVFQSKTILWPSSSVKGWPCDAFVIVTWVDCWLKYLVTIWF